MTTLTYIDQLVSESISGIEDLCRGSLAAGEIDRDALAAAVRSQIEIKNDRDFRRLPVPCQDFLDSVQRSSDGDLLSIVAKTLRSVRFAAFTFIIGKDAEYVDSPLEFGS